MVRLPYAGQSYVKVEVLMPMGANTTVLNANATRMMSVVRIMCMVHGMVVLAIII